MSCGETVGLSGDELMWSPFFKNEVTVNEKSHKKAPGDRDSVTFRVPFASYRQTVAEGGREPWTREQRF